MAKGWRKNIQWYCVRPSLAVTTAGHHYSPRGSSILILLEPFGVVIVKKNFEGL